VDEQVACLWKVYLRLVPGLEEQVAGENGMRLLDEQVAWVWVG
jgi:hypothetical protein